jgi:hypothetical protein
MISRLLAIVVFAAGISAAQADPYVNGNDTGGIIAWSPENELVAVSTAQGHCAWYGKEAYITSVYRQSGHYIGFACAFPRGYIVPERNFAIRTRG